MNSRTFLQLGITFLVYGVVWRFKALSYQTVTKLSK